MTKYEISVYDDMDDEWNEKYFEQCVRGKEEAITLFKTKAKEIISDMASKGLFVSVWREFEWCERHWSFKCSISGYKDSNGDAVVSKAVYMNNVFV